MRQVDALSEYGNLCWAIQESAESSTQRAVAFAGHTKTSSGTLSTRAQGTREKGLEPFDAFQQQTEVGRWLVSFSSVVLVRSLVALRPLSDHVEPRRRRRFQFRVALDWHRSEAP